MTRKKSKYPPWKRPLGFGICSVHEKWEEVNHIRIAYTGVVADDYVNLCRWYYEDYVANTKG